MTEEAAVFGGMAFRQRRLALGVVAGPAQFFRFFFLHGMEFLVDLVWWQLFGGLGRGIPQKKKSTQAEGRKQEIEEEGFFIFGFLHPMLLL
jgi:hypothetical protein